MKKALCATSPFSQPAPHHVTSPAGSAFRDLPRYALHPGAKRHPFTWPWAAMGPGRHMPASYQFFPMCNIRSKIALSRTFPSSCVTSGSPQPAPQPPPGHIPVFPMCNIRSKIALPRTFASSCVTSGSPQPAPQPPPGHIPVFPMCNIRSKNALPRTFPSPCVTSGKRRDSTGVFIAFESAKITPSNCSAALSGAKSAKIGCENCSAPFREPKAQKEGVKIAFCQDIDEGINWCSALWPNGGINFGRLAE